MEKGFVNILTAYSDRDKELNIDYLSSIYADREKINHLVHNLLEGKIERDIIEGKSVLLKPNWVKHNVNNWDEICLCTHEHFILAVLEEILSYKPSKVLLADAPVNVCKWDLLLSCEFYNEIERLQNNTGIEIEVKDFRRTITDLDANKVVTGRVPMDEYVIFDVGEKSHLEPITTGDNRFRITNYNPDDMKNYHGRGMHKYCIAKDFFDYDVVFTLPKMKTHQKTGFTNALKILIGINGDKDYLPHHRLGAADHGGDCYKKDSQLRRMAEWASDQKNKRLGKKSYLFYSKLSSFCWAFSRTEPGMSLSAGWYGNDTIWRTVMDIQMIANYGSVDSEGNGIINELPQRKVYSICDGIIGGQGNGPLSPDPLPLGVVAFSDNSYLMDVVGGVLMGMAIDKIPLLHFAKINTDLEASTIKLNDQMININDLKDYSVNAQMPIGWVHYND